MTAIDFYKLSALPANPQPNSVYFIASSESPDLLEVFVTNSNASSPHRHTLRRSEVQAMIDASTGGGVNELNIYNTIAARDASNPTQTVFGYVIDATGDPTVNSGGATYIYRVDNSTWIKVSESESMDLVLSWANITGKPASSPAEIDNAVNLAETASQPGHGHSIGDVSGLGDALAGKAPTVHNHSIADVTGLSAALLSWAYLKDTWSIEPTLAGTTATGEVYSYTLGGVTRFRFVPTVYDPTQDAFYSTFTAGVLSGLIVTRG